MSRKRIAVRKYDPAGSVDNIASKSAANFKSILAWKLLNQTDNKLDHRRRIATVAIGSNYDQLMAEMRYKIGLESKQKQVVFYTKEDFNY